VKKNKLLVAGIFSIALIFSLAFAGCSSSDDDDGPPPWTDVTDDYDLSQLNGVATDLTIKAEKNPGAEEYRITLTGTVAAAYGYDPSLKREGGSWVTAEFGPFGNDEPADGKYASIYIKGILGDIDDDIVLGVKQTNEALKFYQDALLYDGTLSEPQINLPNIEIPDSGKPVKWKLYENKAAIYTPGTGLAGAFGVLIWDKASDKTVTLEIQSYAEVESWPPDGLPAETDDVKVKVTIDYRDVTFASFITGAQASGVSIASAALENPGELNEQIKITLSGTPAAAYVYDTTADAPGDSWITSEWAGASNTPAAGKYTAIFINGILDDIDPNAVLGVKQTNEALKFYTGDTTLSGSPLSEPQQGFPNIYLTSGTPVKWKLYQTKNNIVTPGAGLETAFGVLIWSGATDKTVTLEITRYAAYTADADVEDDDDDAFSQKIVIDYKGVTFGTVAWVNATGYTVALPPNSQSTALTVSKAEKSAAADEYRITVSGSLNATDEYVTTGGPAVGAAWITSEWAGAGNTPAAGKYAAIFIDGILSELPASAPLGVKQTNEALKFYTGDTTLSADPLTAPQLSLPNIYLTSGTPVKWKLYQTKTNIVTPGAGLEAAFGVLIWDGAADKTVTLEITRYKTYTAGADVEDDDDAFSQKIVIDYSGVTF
jgi:hypothetical protein